MRAGLTGAALAATLALPLAAQEAPPPAAPETETLPIQSPVLILRQDELFDRSAFGRASLVRLDEANRALLAENRQIETALEAEERDLTDQRARLPAPEFRALAEAFDAKVEGIRAAQEAKGRAIARSRDEDRQRFFSAALPILAEIMRDAGAAVILNDEAVILSFDRVDITALAVARIDAAIGTGEGGADPAPVAPAPVAPGTPAPVTPAP
ncbi:MAG TPA: OmpH family outer membrane protein [Paracoccaceae bacterium]|nr:OmpH family outer membrane protein [Paracoccaceae bacterium]